VGIVFDYPDGATPLGPDEAAALLQSHITTHKQLNEWELYNITKADQWVFDRPLKHKKILSLSFMRHVHTRMFNETWGWAGALRQRETKPGIAPEQIQVAVEELCRDVEAQLHYKCLPLDEIAARFHHRLVFTHPFPNGNGRLCRILADLLLVQNNAPRFTWGSGNLMAKGETRVRYISALRVADGHDYGPLFAFVRT